MFMSLLQLHISMKLGAQVSRSCFSFLLGHCEVVVEKGQVWSLFTAYAFCSNENENLKNQTNAPRTHETTRGSSPGIPKILYFETLIWVLVTAFCIILCICYTCKTCSSAYTGQHFSFFGRRQGIKWVLLGICLTNPPNFSYLEF